MPRLPQLRFVILTAFAMAMLAGRACSEDGLPVCTAQGPQWNPVVVSAPAGGAWVTWLDRRTGYSSDVYSSLLDAAGSPPSGAASQGTALTWITCLKSDLSLVPDGTGGTIACWADHRCGEFKNYDIYALRLTPAGTPAPGWPVNGTALTDLDGDQLRPAMAPDGSGGALLAWVDRSARPARLFAGHVLANGALDPAWPTGGQLLASAVSDSAIPSVAADGAGGFYVAWDDARNANLDVRAQRVTGAGLVSDGWPGTGAAVSVTGGDQMRATLRAGSEGALVAWLDRRTGVRQVYASRLLPNGARAPGWAAAGNALAPSANDQAGLVVAAMGPGEAVFAWRELRAGGTGLDVFAQRADSASAVAPGWPAAGVLVCGAAGDQAPESAVPGGAGGALVGWIDGRDSVSTGLDLYVSLLEPGGDRADGWPVDGAPLCVAAGEQRELRLAADDTGGAFAIWTDGRNAATSGDDIATRHIGATGPATGRVAGLAATHHHGQTFLRWNTPPGNNWKYRVYASATPIATPADLGAATVVGVAGDSSACDLRLSRVRGSLFGYRVDPSGPDLDPGSGLFVRTVPTSGATYYAVTAQPGAFGEDTFVAVGQTALASAVEESLATPRPIFQRELQGAGLTLGVWTLWTTDAGTPGFPAMANAAGVPFDFAVARGAASGAPLVVRFHPMGGDFVGSSGGAGIAGEWVLSLDDPLPNGKNTFWYGYHPAYDVKSSKSAPPSTGPVVDYTARRVDWTLDWLLREFPLDTSRVYTYGYSMGAMGATQLAFRSPGRIAGVMSVIGQYDFSFLDDPNPACWFNPGGSFRALADQIWGTVDANLPAPDGLPVFQHLNGRLAATSAAAVDLPPIMAFNGRKDPNVGWAEKVAFWRAMEEHRRGGYFFWDNRNHGTLGIQWAEMQVPAYLARFRNDRSYPALSYCDADDELGDGTPASGDSVGTLNAFVEWTVPVDEPGQWADTLTLRDLVRASGPVVAPDSVLVDVTPRRVQRFRPAPQVEVSWRVVRLGDGFVVAQGTQQVGADGAVTIPGVRVYRDGSRLELSASVLAAPGPPAGPRALRLSCSTLARYGRLAPVVCWPGSEESRLELLDVGGRRVATLFHGRPDAGEARYEASPPGLRAGLYFLRARSGAAQAVRRVVVLR